MATITLANFPDELYEALSKRAAENHRKLGEELVSIAIQTLDCRDGDADEAALLHDVEAERDSLSKKGVVMSDERMADAKA